MIRRKLLAAIHTSFAFSKAPSVDDYPELHFIIEDLNSISIAVALHITRGSYNNILTNKDVTEKIGVINSNVLSNEASETTK